MMKSTFKQSFPVAISSKTVVVTKDNGSRSELTICFRALRLQRILTQANSTPFNCRSEKSIVSTNGLMLSGV